MRGLILAAAIALLWTQGAGGFAAVGLFQQEITPDSTPQVFESSTPEVTSVAPQGAGPKSEARLKIKGKNFAQGVKVSFSNPGIRVPRTTATPTLSNAYRGMGKLDLAQQAVKKSE